MTLFLGIWLPSVLSLFPTPPLCVSLQPHCSVFCLSLLITTSGPLALPLSPSRMFLHQICVWWSLSGFSPNATSSKSFLPPHPKTEPSSPACPSKLPSTESLGFLFHRIYHHLPRKETIFQKPRFWLLLFLYFFMSQPHRMFVCRGREFFCFIFNCDKTFLT